MSLITCLRIYVFRTNRRHGIRLNGHDWDRHVVARGMILSAGLGVDSRNASRVGGGREMYVTMDACRYMPAICMSILRRKVKKAEKVRVEEERDVEDRAGSCFLYAPS